MDDIDFPALGFTPLAGTMSVGGVAVDHTGAKFKCVDIGELVVIELTGNYGVDCTQSA